jgi:hypothetical protein
MNGRLPLELDDARIERMLASRAARSAPADLVPAIVAAVASEPQRRAWRTPGLPANTAGGRMLAVAAALAVVAVAGAVLVGGALRSSLPPTIVSPAPRGQVQPSTSPSARTPSLSPSASADASASPPASSASPGTQPVGRLAPVIALKVGASNATLLAIDALTGDRTQLGTMPFGGPAGQSVLLTADR